MLIQVIKSKIHRVTVTQAELNYIGSITIDRELMDASGIVEGERVFIVDINNGERFDTYVVIIMAYALVTPEEARTFRPRVIFPDTATNRLPEQPHNNE